MNKKIIAMLLVLSLLFTGCEKEEIPVEQPLFSYSSTLASPYGGNCTLTALCVDEETFHYYVGLTSPRLQYYSELFSTENYSDYGNTLKDVEEQSGIEAVVVPHDTLELLYEAKVAASEMGVNTRLTGGSVIDFWDSFMGEVKAYYYALEELAALELTEEDLAELAPIEPPTLDLEALEALSSTIHDEQFYIEDSSNSVLLDSEGMTFSLYHFGEAYSLELLGEYLADLGLERFQLSTKNFTQSFGDPAEECWYFGLTDPTAEQSLGRVDGLIDTLCLKNEGVAIVGMGYDEAYTLDGEIYHRIVNMDSLQPVSDYYGVVVIDGEGVAHAERLATALCVQPIESGKNLAKLFGDAEVLWIHEDGRLEITDGFVDYMLNRGQKYHVNE